MNRLLIGEAVTCTVCQRRKAPRGRSVPPEAASGYCDRECDGHLLSPIAGDLWPGERREDFGYPRELADIATEFARLRANDTAQHEQIAKLGRELAERDAELANLAADLTVSQEEADGWEGEANKLKIGYHDKVAELAAKDKLIESMINAVDARADKRPRYNHVDAAIRFEGHAIAGMLRAMVEAAKL